MTPTLTFILVGALFVVMALATSVLKRLPLSTSLLYLAAGYAVGPAALGLIDLDPVLSAALLERITELAVVVSLFTAGLKLRLPLLEGGRLNSVWRPAIRLASVSMTVTVGLIAFAAWGIFDLPIGAAVLLGAILAPTDPVLASDVQVENATDRDRLRFSLTGEAGLNDGTAFPFVMLGMGMLGLHEIGSNGWRWLTIDVLWAVAGGLVIGGLLGTAVGRLVLYLRREHKEAVGLDDFLALGLIALAYGLALLVSTYGFLAVFAAGQALRRIERHHSGPEASPDVVAVTTDESPEEVATDPERAPAYMAQAVLGFNEQLERIGEVLVVILLGAMLSLDFFTWETVGFIALVLLVLRPVSVAIGLAGSDLSGVQRRLIAWFGIRGIGSVYYLTYAIEHGLPEDLGRSLAGITLATVAASAVVHGISVTPLMHKYSKQSRAKGSRREPGQEQEQEQEQE